MSTMKALTPLTNAEIKETCPGFFAQDAQQNVSDRYSFLSTERISGILAERGWMPVFARETRSISEANRGFNKHIVRWAHEDLLVGDERIELVGINSHNRRSPFRFLAGIFRLVCENGLITQSADFGNFSIRHIGNVTDEVNEAIGKITDLATKLSTQMNEFKAIELTPSDKGIFARAAHQFVYSKENSAKRKIPALRTPHRMSHAPIEASQLLVPRREVDDRSDLWTTFNVIQENLMRGGLESTSSIKRKSSTRQVTSITREIHVNQALWQITENMAKFKLAA